MWAVIGVFGFAVGLAVATCLAAPIMAFLRWTKSSQTISAHAPATHQVKQGTPTMGGLIILSGAIASVAIQFAFQVLPWVWSGKVAGMILLVGFGLIGFVDDFVVPRTMKGKRGLGWKQKIVMQIVIGAAATQAMGLGVTVQAGWYLFLILFFSNAYNFSDGLDGLAGTLLLGFGLGIGLMAPMLAGREVIVSLILPMLGATIVFLFLNAPPAKVFMGDVGSLPIGAVLGLCVAVASSPDSRFGPTDIFHGSLLNGPAFPLVLLSIVMIAELVPVPLQIFSVKVFKRKLFPFTPIHHAFERAGWPETRVVYAFALVQLVGSALAAGLMFMDYAASEASRPHF